MIEPARLDLAGDRWVPFIRSLPVVNALLEGATFAMQVRLLPDTEGEPLIALGTVSTASAQGVRVIASATDTVAAHIVAGRLIDVPAGYDVTDEVDVTLLGIRINELTMESLPAAGELGADLTLYWDLHITPIGGVKDRYAGGKFIVRAGVTH